MTRAEREQAGVLIMDKFIPIHFMDNNFFRLGYSCGKKKCCKKYKKPGKKRCKKCPDRN